MELESYQIALIAGRVYQVVLFFYGFILLVRLRVWVLLGLAVLGAGAGMGFYLLAILGEVPPATPYRLLGVYGPALFLHVALVVVNTLANRQPLGRLRPFGAPPHADA